MMLGFARSGLALLVVLTSGVALVSAEDASALIDQKLLPTVVKHPGHLYQAKGAKDQAGVRLSLKKISRKGNDITDGDRWFAANVLPSPIGPKDEHWRHIPGVTRWGDLKFFRSTESLHVGIYEVARQRTGAKDEKGMSSIYDKEFTYTAVVFNADFVPQKLFVLEEFHPGILEMSDAHVAGKILYFDCNYNGYANIVSNRTGYLVALDLEAGEVLWTSGQLASSYRGFVVYEGAIITGYGFTEEKDYLYVFNRFTGKQWLKTSLKSAPEFIVPKDGKLYVRTYDTNYLFEIVEKTK